MASSKKQNKTRPPESAGPGRPTMTKGGRPLARSSLTAPEGYLEFLKRAGGENTVSAGVRRIVEDLVAKDERYARLMRQVRDEGHDIGNLNLG